MSQERALRLSLTANSASSRHQALGDGQDVRMGLREDLLFKQLFTFRSHIDIEVKFF